MKDNTRTAIGYVCIALVFISYFVMLGWIGSPRDFTFKIEMDNNTKDAFQSINYSEINEIQEYPNNLYEDCEYDGCNYVCEYEDGTSISTLRYCYNMSDDYKEKKK